ncbi:hypothetical protein FQ085_11560 [Planococcus sp. ANT_H30]|uniref:SGNH/GDSL hydrolase family protein n=1 Tax=Planococcus sp. ANT_H30 TaxID=2597347 RepID=UPI0011EFD1C0|nr:SGNH/GDSL hydrolase family protein [Planococcus sp. ANT_H30]KAA0956624.1 hypothetical protein FQ085_11560 [Planococcus sp. ANT_H30]
MVNVNFLPKGQVNNQVANTVKVLSPSIVKQGDTENDFLIQLLKADVPIDLTGKIVTWSAASNKGKFVSDRAATSQSNGTVGISFVEGDAAATGSLRIEFKVKHADGDIEKFPANSFAYLEVTRSLDDLAHTPVLFASVQYFESKVAESNVKATQAETKAIEAEATANEVRDQFEQVVIEGDSSVEAAAARVAKDKTYANLKARLDAEQATLTTQLEEKVGGTRKATMDDLGQDVKTAMTGGSVAVVGTGAVGTVNVQSKAITPEKTNFLEKTTNLFDKTAFETGFVPNGSYNTGQVTDKVVSATRSISPIYENVASKTFSINRPFTTATDMTIAIYRDTGVSLGSVNYTLQADGSYRFTIPSNAYYMRFGVYNELLNQDFMLVEGTTLPTDYLPAGYVLKQGVKILKTDLSFDVYSVSNKVKLALPETMDFIAGKKGEIFEYGLVDADIHDSEYIVGYDVDASTLQRHGRIIVDNTAISTKTVQTKNIILYNKQYRNEERKSVKFNIVPPVANPTSAKNILFVGDSLVGNNNQAFPKEFQRLLRSTDTDAYGLTNFNLVGRVNLNGVRYEGTGGYGWNNYVDNPTTLNPSYGNNYFWDSAIGDINIQKYMTDNCSGVSLDYVVIELGWNHYVNGSSGYSSDITVIKAKAKYFIDKVLAAYPNCKILLCGNQKTAPYIYEIYAPYWALANKHNIQLAKTYEALAKEYPVTSVRYVDIKSRFDSEHNMPYAEEQVNFKNAKTAKYCTDFVHPDLSGFNQMASVVLASFFAIQQA